MCNQRALCSSLCLRWTQFRRVIFVPRSVPITRDADCVSMVIKSGADVNLPVQLDFSVEF